MSAPAHPAKMEQNATIVPMGLSAAVLKVRAFVPKSCHWIFSFWALLRIPRQKSRCVLTTCWAVSLLSVQCFLGVSYFSGRLLGKQTDLRPLIPLVLSLAFKIVGSLRTSSCQERSRGHHPDICSSLKLPHTTLCCILIVIPLHKNNKNIFITPDMVRCGRICHKDCIHELAVCIHWYLACLFGPMPMKEPASLFQWPAAWYSLCLWAPSVE